MYYNSRRVDDCIVQVVQTHNVYNLYFRHFVPNKICRDTIIVAILSYVMVPDFSFETRYVWV